MKLVHFLSLPLLLTSVTSLWAVQTREISHQGHDDFKKAELNNISLTDDGLLKTGPAIEVVSELEASIIWSAAQGKNGTLFVATGNKGRILAIQPSGEVQVIFEPEEMLARALALGPDGALYVGTSPNGRIYRLPGPGQRAEIYFDPSETYIWDIKFDKDGNLFFATGNRGRVYKLNPDHQPGDKPELWYEDVSAHFVTLGFDNKGNVLAGSDPDGNIYRMTEPFEGEVLYNSNGGEIRKIHQLQDGEIFFSTFKGAAKPSSNGKDSDESTSSSPKSLFYKIKTDGYVEVFWRNPDEPIYSFESIGDKGWVVGTGNKGNLHQIQPDGKWQHLQTLEDGGEITTMITDNTHKGGLLLFTSNPARIYRLTDKPASTGNLVSEVIDVKQVAKWGRVHTFPQSDKIEIFTRGGNTEKITGAWSEWEKLKDTGHIQGSSRRYLQYKVKLNSHDIELHKVRLFYQINNARPYIRNINVVPNGYSITSLKAITPILTLDKLTKGSLSDGPPKPPPARKQLSLNPEDALHTAGWDATDPNGDDLRFDLQLRRLTGNQEWIQLAKDLEQPVYTFTTHGMEDGYYRLKVTASDHIDNPAGTAESNFLLSQQFLIDNTSPTLTSKFRKAGNPENITHVDITATDNFCLLHSAEYILNGAKPAPLFPTDQIFDDQKETFHFALPKNLPAGNHSLIINVTDDRGNRGTRQITFQTK